MQEKLKRSKNNPEWKKIQVNLIKGLLRDLKEKIEDMSQQEIENENPNETVDIVEMILEFNGQRQMQGLKILTPNEMLSRLLITLVQLKAGKVFEKLKNKIRQLFCSLYRSKRTYRKYL